MAENNLMERTQALVKEHSAKWKRLTEILHSEGFTQDDGTPLTVDTLRKRYKRWVEQSGATTKTEELHSQESGARGGGAGPEMTAATAEPSDKTERSAEAMVPVSELLALFKGTLERRDAMLAQKLQADSEKQYAEVRMSTVEARLEEKLLRRLKEELVELVEDSVDQELKSMVTPGGSLERELKLLVGKVIDEKASGQLVSLIGEIGLGHEHRGGPGRSHKGKRTARFSATMDGETYSHMKDLGGTFSSHLTAACQVYLRALESKREHT
ncbi:MAG: hypothetical protein ACLP5H_17335 [Desulfomonilaceae bacterium]